MVEIRIENEVMTVVIDESKEGQSEQFVLEAKRQLDILNQAGRLSGELLKISAENPVVKSFVVAYVSTVCDAVCVFASDIKRWVVISSFGSQFAVGDLLY